MTLAIRSPRKSALGVDFLEDGKRGKLAVRKNQGILNGNCNVDVDGYFHTFAAAVSWLQYPRLITGGRTAITVGCWVKDFVHSGVTQFIMGQASLVGWDNNIEFMLYVNAADTMAFYLKRQGAAAVAVSSILLLDANPTFIAATWASADTTRIFVNGEQNNAGAAGAGTINDADQPLTVGLRANGDVPLTGRVREPWIEFRRWSAAEIRDYYRRVLFV